MSGSHQIRHDRMNDGLFRHWITEWTKLPSQILAEPVQDMDEILDSSTNSLMESDQDDDEDTKQNKLPSQILAEAVQDTDEILDFPTDSSMESDQDDDEETKNLKRKYKNLEKRTKRLEKEKNARELSEDKKRRAQDAHDSLVTYLVTKFNRYFACVRDPQFKIFETLYNNDGTVNERIRRSIRDAKQNCEKYEVENPDGKPVTFYDIWKKHIANKWLDRASDSPWDNGQHVLNLATNQKIDPLWKLLASFTGPKGAEIPLIFTDKFVYKETKFNWQFNDMAAITKNTARNYWAREQTRKGTQVAFAIWAEEFIPAAVQACKKYWPNVQLIWDQDNPIYDGFVGRGKKNKACEAFRTVLSQCKGMNEMIFNTRMGQGNAHVCIHFPHEYDFMVEMLTDSELMPDEPFSVDDWDKARRAQAEARAVQILAAEEERVDRTSAQNSDENGEPDTPPAKEAQPSAAVNEPAKNKCGRPKSPRKPTDGTEKTKTSTKRPATLNPTPRTKARKLHKDIEATLDDPATGLDISVLRSTYKNHFGTSPTSTHPTELRDVLIDAGIDNQIQAGIDPLSIISDAHPEFANLLSVIDRDLVNDSLKKKKKPKTCHGCNTNTKLLSNPDGKFWCRSCFWERERLKQNNGRGRQ